jgi:CHAD domain-containing protein
VHDDDDIEDVHQMRVATRKLRATLQTLGPLVAPNKATKFRRQLHAVASSLGEVRDRDVLLEHLRAHQDQAGAAALIEVVEQERGEVRKRLIKQLESRRYARFKAVFSTFLTASDSAEAPVPMPLVRYAAGSLIWRSYEELRIYETVVPVRQTDLSGTNMALLHQMRIAGKHLRYTLELFADALGPRTDQVLDPLMELQEYLGSLQDIEVAGLYVERLPEEQRQAATDGYLAARLRDQAQLLADLPRRWEKVASATFRRRLMELIVKL